MNHAVFLGDFNLLGQLQTGYACTRRNDHVQGVQPFMQGYMGSFKDGPGTDGKILLACITTVIPAFTNGNLGLVMTTMRASHPIQPS